MIYQCPKCKSDKVGIQYPNILCRTCGNTDSFEDYPISHEHYRSMCFEYNRPVPISCTTIIKEKESNIKKEKEYVITREQSGQLQQIHGEIYYLKNKLDEHLARSKKKAYTIE